MWLCLCDFFRTWRKLLCLVVQNQSPTWPNCELCHSVWRYLSHQSSTVCVHKTSHCTLTCILVKKFLVKIKHVQHEDSGFKAVGQLGSFLDVSPVQRQAWVTSHSKLTSGVNVHVNDCMWSCDGPASCPRSTLPLALGWLWARVLFLNLKCMDGYKIIKFR